MKMGEKGQIHPITRASLNQEPALKKFFAELKCNLRMEKGGTKKNIGSMHGEGLRQEIETTTLAIAATNCWREVKKNGKNMVGARWGWL